MSGRANGCARIRHQVPKWTHFLVALTVPCQHLADFNASPFRLQARSGCWWRGTPQHLSFDSLRPTTWCLGNPSRAPFKPSERPGSSSCPVSGCVPPQPPSESAEHISSLWFYVQPRLPSNLGRLQLFSFKQRNRLLYFSRASVLGLAC